MAADGDIVSDVESLVAAEVREKVKKPRAKKAKKAKEAVQEEVAITVPALEKKKVQVTVRGLTEILFHRFDEKARKEMEDKQQGVAKNKKAFRDPQQEFKDSLYWIDEKTCGIPGAAFKLAAVSACRYVDGVSMAHAKGSFHVIETLIPIKGDGPHLQVDTARIGGFKKTATPRYRGRFEAGWEATFTVIYNSHAISEAQLFHLFNVAGFSVGVCEWRPEKGGKFGMFEVV